MIVEYYSTNHSNSLSLEILKPIKNLLLLKTEMEAGHGGKSGRDASIKEIAFDYSFILKICKLLSTWKK